MLVAVSAPGSLVCFCQRVATEMGTSIRMYVCMCALDGWQAKRLWCRGFGSEVRSNANVVQEWCMVAWNVDMSGAKSGGVLCRRAGTSK